MFIKSYPQYSRSGDQTFGKVGAGDCHEESTCKGFDRSV